MADTRELDVVVFGATGFTGRLIVDHLMETYGAEGSVKWAMAGRSQSKLESVRAEIGAPASVPVIVADTDDLDALKEMAGRTKAVVTSVGPFQLYGSNLVQACAETGTDYLDLAGEPVWVREMIDQHEATAKSTGARLVFSAGYDSIPSELGVWFTQKLAVERFGKPVPRVNGRVSVFAGGIGGGSAASGAATRAAVAKDPSMGPKLMNPFLLTPGFDGVAQPPSMQPEKDTELNNNVVPFFLAMVNTKSVHRANMLLGYPWGESFLYQEMMLDTPEAAGSFPDAANLPGGPPKPGEGPSKEERDNGSHEMVFVGLADDGKRIKVSVGGKGDPGFRSTSRMIAETALCLIDTPDLSGGAWTPVAALGEKLMDRLTNKAQITVREEAL